MAEPVIVGGIVATTVYVGYRFVRWIKGLLLSRSLSIFANKYIQNSSKTLCKALAIDAKFMDEIWPYLKHRGVCSSIAKTGSIHDGLSVGGDNDIQLEVLILQTISGCDIEINRRDDMLGYAWLRFIHGSIPVFDRVLSHWSVLGALIGNRYLDAEKTIDVIYKELQKCIAESKQMTGKVKLNRSGRVLQMEVYPNSWMLSWGSRLYTVNIVPAYRIGEELYEWKPLNGGVIPDDTMTWQRTFALQEKQKLCDGSKMVLRVLKVLRKRESDFGNFTFYQLKTVVLHETDANQDWSELMLGKRLTDVLERLEKCLAARNLPHYFSPNINLLSKISPGAMDHLRDRIQRLRTSESEMRKLLQ